MVYVMSDIHGNLRRFDSIMEQVNLQHSDTLYVLGDVIDRHADGIHILRRIMAMPNVNMLLGNHEYMMLRALGVPYDGPEDIAGRSRSDLLGLWYRNGGGITHHKLKHIRKTVRSDIFEYLHSLPLNIDITVDGQPYKLVHAALVDKYPIYGSRHYSPTHFAVWERDAIIQMPAQKEYTLIFGHTPTENLQPGRILTICHREKKIAIDCGSGFEEIRPDTPFADVFGRLACLRLDDMKEFYSEEPCLKGKRGVESWRN